MVTLRAREAALTEQRNCACCREFVGGWWVARTAEGLFLYGLLLGALAAVIYGGLTRRASLPVAYSVANYLKLAGGAGGGLWLE
jgi:hypothetical protein